MILNENIKKFRKESGLTQKALASKSGLSFSMISKLESGEQSNPSFETIRKIAEVLEISPGNLVSAPPTIEEQIDEYIEYKRGLDKVLAKPVQNRKMSREYPDYLENRPEMMRLFFALKNASKDEINQVTLLVETFKGMSRLP